MYNWSTDTQKLKENPEAWAIYKLEQTINFGLNNEKISTVLLKKYWEKLQIDPDKKRYLSSLLWPKS